MAPKRTIQYSDLINDDFAGNNIHTASVGPEFPFARTGKLWRFWSALVYYAVAFPLVFLISKLYLGLRFENRQAVKPLRRKGYFLYCNHTRSLDAFLPAMTAFPGRAYVLAGADAVSIRGIRTLVQLLGVIPIPTSFAGMRGFLAAVSLRAGQKSCVAVFPEAHIWPFYTGIRPFGDTSFRYPVKEGMPAVAAVVTYRRRRGLFRLMKKPGMTVTLSEPMYPDASLPPRAAQRDLRDRVYGFMTEVSASRENVAYIDYIPMAE